MQFVHVLNPWKIEIDFNKGIIIVQKRNWHLISVDETIIPFRQIRRLEIDTHIFGASVLIKVFGSGEVIARYLSKRSARKIKKEVINLNESDKSNIIIN